MAPAGARVGATGVTELDLVVPAADLKRLETALEKLPREVYRKVVVNAVRQAAKPMLAASKAGVPVSAEAQVSGKLEALIGKPVSLVHGLLRDSLKTKIVKYEQDMSAVAIIGADTKVSVTVTADNGRSFKQTPAKYIYLIEFGVGPHVIKLKQKRAGRLRVKGTGRTIRHPGFPPNPFLRNAVLTSASEVISKYTTAVARGVVREAKKLARGA